MLREDTPVWSLSDADWRELETQYGDVIRSGAMGRFGEHWRRLETVCTELRVGDLDWCDQFEPRAGEQRAAHGKRIYDDLVSVGMTFGELRAILARLHEQPAAGILGVLLLPDGDRARRARLDAIDARIAALNGQIDALMEERACVMAHAAALRAQLVRVCAAAARPAQQPGA